MTIQITAFVGLYQSINVILHFSIKGYFIQRSENGTG